MDNIDVSKNAIETGIYRGCDLIKIAYVIVQLWDINDKINKPQDKSFVDFVI